MYTYVLKRLAVFSIIILVGCGQVDQGQPSDDVEIDINADHEYKEEDHAERVEEGLEPLKVHFIDVGQADATLFEYSVDGEEYRILFDAGHWMEEDLLHYLQANDIEHIDIMVGSHPHSDHIGQMDLILETMDVSEVWMSGDVTTSQTFLRVIEAVEASDADYHEPRAGEVYDVGPLEIEILNPDQLTGDVHEGSIGAMFTYGDTRFVLTGDAEKQTEEAMIKRGYDLDADVLKLGHHGSSTSTIPAFLQAVNPAIAIISAGEDNQYGHPHREVVERVADAKVEMYATFVHGTIVVESDGETLQIRTEREGYMDPSNQQLTEIDEEPLEEQAVESDCININEATIELLQEINHIGEERAETLIELRPFESMEDLIRINGIGDGRLADIINEGIACVR
ncbi:MBL fold metallo-hydrolase [Alkalihalobacillus hemicellulosilyticus]|uniref:Late competence protein ComEC n=1 Tax=Halalkalibacter hemicellulosilyticusJCM 9152 TaxID=1236971 RepID=W4QDA3_9BACI|nr:MBL fold metallo-hydrolase [Halalkalibacter hemicellulosilyticus]GAE29668.1 late competence protein ComEC [Halalkalibacter hemicellulosilyticusJCM 9152]